MEVYSQGEVINYMEVSQDHGPLLPVLTDRRLLHWGGIFRVWVLGILGNWFNQTGQAPHIYTHKNS